VKDRLATMVARGILHGFRVYYAGFKEIMGRSKRRFEERDWPGLQTDADERLTLYQRAIERSCEYVQAMLEERAFEALPWSHMRESYEIEGVDPANGDLALAYFNTVKRRFIPTGPEDFAPHSADAQHPEQFVEEVRVLEFSRGADAIPDLIRRILELFPFQTPYVNLEEDVGQVVHVLEDRLAEGVGRRPIAVLKPLFYRARRAHIIGRMWNRGRYIPLVIAITNSEQGLRLAEVLLGDEETSALFSFTRSQFHVVTAHHRELMGFLRSLAPAKSPADLYASVGYNNLAKSSLLADLFRTLAREDHKFRRTSGVNGTVMQAFELPEFRFVLKIIRDRFLPRRVETSRDKVMRRYRFVQYAERAGRILDIFHFHHVRFQRASFEEDLLEELLSTAPSTIHLDGDSVVFDEFYAQRRVVPLDVFYRSGVDAGIMRRVVIDFGFLHKELAQRNIFTGDVVPNNFGVVSIGKRAMRVVSFDYDGYSRLTDMNFFESRESKPSVPAADEWPPKFDENEDPWAVYDDWASPEETMVINEEWDILPEKFRVTFGVPVEMREEFERVHGELYTTGYWTNLQAQIRRRPEFVDAFPYPMLAK
jgi:isocitrate dehydrogenase kinase/phosphatase